jgi:hypothetical protein
MRAMDQMRIYKEEMGSEAFARQVIQSTKVNRRIHCNCSQRFFGGREIVSKFHRHTCPLYLP